MDTPRTEEARRNQEQCTHCHKWFPKPVELHHSEAECGSGEDPIEEGRRLASERDDLIASGVDPSLLAVPIFADSDLCPECEEPRDIPGEGRFCGSCQDYEGHCINDHCMTCGGTT